MDKTEHPDWIIILTYTLMGFCWGGKAGLNIVEMAVCGISCLLQGVVVVALEKTKLPVYVCRFFGVLAAGTAILAINLAVEYPHGFESLFVAMILPVAAGAMLVEGMYTSHTSAGKKKMIIAVLCSLALGLAIFLSMSFMGVEYA